MLWFENCERVGRDDVTNLDSLAGLTGDDLGLVNFFLVNNFLHNNNSNDWLHANEKEK